MSCYDRMLSHLQSTRLYDMSKDYSLVKAEMKAYATVLEDIFDEINELCRTCFIDEVSNPHCAYFERMFGFSVTNVYNWDNLTEQETLIRNRKIECMKKRLKINNGSFTKSGIIDAIASGGMTAQITEQQGTQELQITVTDDWGLLSSNSVKTDFISKFIPEWFSYSVVFSS